MTDRLPTGVIKYKTITLYSSKATKNHQDEDQDDAQMTSTESQQLHLIKPPLTINRNLINAINSRERRG